LVQTSPSTEAVNFVKDREAPDSSCCHRQTPRATTPYRLISPERDIAG
jgi:hypothetical protein